MKKLRSLICTVVGHVDHGKTTIIDHIRGTTVAEKEVGLITQNISCCELPLKGMQAVCKSKPEFSRIKLPGLLFIDTPGHMAFNNLRKRGGSLADIAILVIDINEGIKDQTVESIEILKKNKIPFIIAANKIDLIPGYQIKKEAILENIEAQSEVVKTKIQTKIYNIVGKLSAFNLNADVFNKINDFTKKIAIVPLSAKKEQGIADLLLVLCGLAQRFLEKNLNVDTNKDGKATILEIKEEKGLGLALDTVIYDGNIKKGDTILIAGLEKPIKTKVKGLFNIENKKLVAIEKAEAAAYVKILTPSSEDAVAGMPIIVANEKNTEKKEKEIQKEIEEVLLETDKEGVIVKADSLGSLEALIGLLKDNDILIKKASIGDINKTDIAEADAEENKLFKVILSFNVKQKADVNKEVKIINKDIIYKIVEEYKEFEEKEKKSMELKAIEHLQRPFKILILNGCVFRQKSPAVVGVEVIQGTLKVGNKVMNELGKPLGEIRTMQLDGNDIKEAKKGSQVAVALPDVIVGRHIFENETLLSDLNEEEFRKLKDMKNYLTPDEIAVLKLIAEIKRKGNKLWGI